MSNPQVGSGARPTRLPDLALEGTVVHSSDYLTRCQRRLGLYLSCLSDVLDAREARGLNVTQHERLGDSCLNASNHTIRHNAVLRTVHTALGSVSATGAVRQGDKGDGTPAAKAEAKQRYAWLNNGHIPDLYRVGPPHTLWEIKCWTPYKPGGSLGRGSSRRGGAASTTDGHFIAFGNTEELLREITLGVKARGNPGDRPLDHTTGAGRVEARDGDYTDALSKGSEVHLLVTETTGAFSHSLEKALRALATIAKLPEVDDTTIYGTSRSSPRSFYGHHAAAVSAAIVFAESAVIRATACTLADELMVLRPPAPRAA